MCTAAGTVLTLTGYNGNFTCADPRIFCGTTDPVLVPAWVSPPPVPTPSPTPSPGVCGAIAPNV